MQPVAMLPHLEKLGARLAPLPEAPQFQSPLTFGAVPAEYAAGVEGALLLEATNQGRIRVTGGEAADFLHRITANDVRGLKPGQSNQGLLLSPKGKITHSFRVSRDADGLYLESAPGHTAALAAALDMFLFTEDAALEDISTSSAPLELVGPLTETVAAAALGVAWSANLDKAPGSHALCDFQGTPIRVTRIPVAGSLGLSLDAGPEHAAALWDALTQAGATPGGFFARDSLRAEAGAALFGVDVDDNIYPQEARWESAFSLTKGCYTGQEVIAKIDTYGGLNKCLVALDVDSDDPVPRGAELFRTDEEEQRAVGVVTTWAYSFALDRGIVLAYAKRRHQAVGTEFRLGTDGPTARIVQHPVRAGALTPTGAFEGV